MPDLLVPRAYAKINLGLFVLDRRPDGYHNILTVFHRIGVYDDIALEPDDAISVVCTTPAAPDGERNICFKAVQLLRERTGISTGAKITITKRIPVGAGLGGGSADAAAALLALPRLWHIDVEKKILDDIALQIGSDVPYFLEPGSAIAGARGENLEYFDLRVPFTILLCAPDIPISTAWAYSQLGPRRPRDVPHLKLLVLDGMHNPLQLVNGLRNDFEPVVFAAHPEVLQVKEALMAAGAVYASMSGSGSSVYAFFAREELAREAADRIQSTGCRTFLTPPLFMAS